MAYSRKRLMQVKKKKRKSAGPNTGARKKTANKRTGPSLSNRRPTSRTPKSRGGGY